jgi:hypothetical protein
VNASLPLIGAKLLELRKRRTLMTVTVVFTVALPVIFYGIRRRWPEAPRSDPAAARASCTCRPCPPGPWSPS